MVAQNLTLTVSLDAAEARLVIVRFLKDYFSGAASETAVLGLSGGLDSAVVAALGADALGPSNIHALVLPSDSSAKEDVDEAHRIAKHLGIEAKTVDIQPLVEAFGAVAGTASRAQLANATARCRMLVLQQEASRRGGLVLGTGNKSELLTGYFTKYGDGGVDVQPLGDLYKAQVRLLAEELALPASVRSKAPSAGLWAGQTDEGELGLAYEVLDRILLGLEIRLAPDKIAHAVGVDASEVVRIDAMRASTQHKRRMPLAPKFGMRSAGLDWRTYTVS